MHLVSFITRYRVIVLFAATLVIASASVPGFLSLGTASLALDRMASTGLLAIGLTVLLITGKIDLSGGAVFALAGIVAVDLQPSLGIPTAATVGLLVGLAAGLFNAFLVVRLEINSLVATLASMLVFRAIAHWVTESQPVSGIDVFFALEFSAPLYGFATIRSLMFVIGILLLHVWLTQTVAGRSVFAVGSSEAAAQASGLRSNRIVALTLIFTSVLAGLGGVVQSLSVNTGSPVFGSDLTILAITAVVVGGTRIEGGVGSALGTLGGVATISLLTTMMEFSSVPAYVQQIVIGTILLVLVMLDRRLPTRTPTVSAVK